MGSGACRLPGVGLPAIPAGVLAEQCGVVAGVWGNRRSGGDLVKEHLSGEGHGHGHHARRRHDEGPSVWVEGPSHGVVIRGYLS
jgi:hypothetical protein